MARVVALESTSRQVQFLQRRIIIKINRIRQIGITLDHREGVEESIPVAAIFGIVVHVVYVMYVNSG